MLGLPVSRIISISDNPDEICSALTDSMSRAQVVLITGGLGPTNDDLTKVTLAKFFNSRLVVDSDVLADIEKLWGSRNMPLSPVNRDQALVPHNCSVIRNPNGTAPGMWFESAGTVVVSMPGVPYEMKGMMEQGILPKLAAFFNAPPVIHKTIMTTGIGESSLAAIIEKWESSIPENYSLAYLPSPGVVKLRITGRGKNTETIKEMIAGLTRQLCAIIPEWVYGFDDLSIEEVLAELLLVKQLTVCTAESCTGGLIASRITQIPGSSAYYKGSVVAYSNDVKVSHLHVLESSLERFGAVSSEVVAEMASHARSIFNTDYSIAVSGIAGPDGGTKEKPVGTVWIAVSGPNGTESERFSMGGHRGRNR
jgi:nicotinamide-nucleotide amidase